MPPSTAHCEGRRSEEVPAEDLNGNGGGPAKTRRRPWGADWIERMDKRPQQAAVATVVATHRRVTDARVPSERAVA
jgi:hypothetical protein